MNPKLRTMKKLARSKNYVVVTDDESIVNVKNVNPNSLTGMVRLSTQRAVLVNFQRKLARAVLSFDRAIGDIVGKKPKAKGKKIKVQKKR